MLCFAGGRETVGSHVFAVRCCLSSRRVSSWRARTGLHATAYTQQPTRNSAAVSVYRVWFPLSGSTTRAVCEPPRAISAACPLITHEAAG